MSIWSDPSVTWGGTVLEGSILTVRDVINRVYRDFLEPSNDQPSRLILDTDEDTTDIDFKYDDSAVTDEEVESIIEGNIIEINREMMLVKSIDHSTKTIVVVRGVNGTTASTHSEGDIVVVDVVWPRQSVFDAVADAIVNLYPSLYAFRTSSELTLGNRYTEVPSTVIEALELLVEVSGYMERADFTFHPVYPLSSTNKAITHHAYSGRSAYLVYRGKFSRPTSEDTSLASLGVDPSWSQLLTISTVAYLISGRDMDLATQDTIVEQLQNQNFPVGSGRDIMAGLMGLRERLLEDAKYALSAQHNETVKQVGLF